MTPSFNKRELSERDICSKYITPALEAAGWNLQDQIREEVPLTPGRIMVRGKVAKREAPVRADYVLYLKPGQPIGVVEAKDNNHQITEGLSQARNYGQILQLPCAHASNGDAFVEEDLSGKAKELIREFPLDDFPGPNELYRRYCDFHGIQNSAHPALEQPFHIEADGKEPRYYQANAVNRTLEAIAAGQKRLLLVMATGTGKTYTVFQIIWRLWKAGTVKRALFLVDRNVLADQTKNQDFSPFGQALTKITNRNAEKSFEIYLSLYQAISGTEEEQNIYKQFSPGFFDLVVVDECHRGSAKDDSAWHDILEYFSSAVKIGMTATPRETKYVSNIHYFGEPVYSYTLKQGIQDGFLAPYKVVRFDLDKDVSGWRPEQGMKDKYGYEIEDRIYNQKDFDRELVLEKRTLRVAEKITQYLLETGLYQKTIVFCETTDHAERMRVALINLNPELCRENKHYVVRITGDDPEGKALIDDFIDVEERYPVIATTSQLLSTGVDTKNVRVIALDKNIQSMTEFKQIIGRGTRVREDVGKMFFTILDFRRATELFADPDFDGDPVQIYEPGDDDSPVPPDGGGGVYPGGEGDHSGESGSVFDPGGVVEKTGKRRVFVVNNVEVRVLQQRVQYLGPDGKLITESLEDYSRKAMGKNFRSLEDFLQRWSQADRKGVILRELEDQGVVLEELAGESGKDLDPFDMLCHMAYGAPALTRRERAENVRKRHYFAKYGDKARKVLEALLDKYAQEGIEALEDLQVLKVEPLKSLGTPTELLDVFGGKEGYLRALHDLESILYASAA